MTAIATPVQPVEERPADVAPGKKAPEDRSLRHSVEHHLLTEVRAGRLAPGDRLKEVTLARSLGVSLTPVREALFRLVHFGHVIHVPRRGFYLANPDAAHTEEVYSMRAVLEGLAASWAARHAQPDELRALEETIEAGERAIASGDPLQAAERFARFHALIVRAARHTLLERAWQMLSPVEWQQLSDRTPRTDPSYATSWGASHRRLLEAIRSGDAARAEQAARDHIERTAARSRSRAHDAP